MTHYCVLKVKVHTLDITPLRSESPPQKRSGMARVRRDLSFTCTPTRSSAIGMSHTGLCLPSYSWYLFTDPGGMEGWVDLVINLLVSGLETNTALIMLISWYWLTQVVLERGCKTVVAVINICDGRQKLPEKYSANISVHMINFYHRTFVSMCSSRWHIWQFLLQSVFFSSLFRWILLFGSHKSSISCTN